MWLLKLNFFLRIDQYASYTEPTLAFICLDFVQVNYKSADYGICCTKSEYFDNRTIWNRYSILFAFMELITCIFHLALFNVTLLRLPGRGQQWYWAIFKLYYLYQIDQTRRSGNGTIPFFWFISTLLQAFKDAREML